MNEPALVVAVVLESYFAGFVSAGVLLWIVFNAGSGGKRQ